MVGESVCECGEVTETLSGKTARCANAVRLAFLYDADVVCTYAAGERYLWCMYSDECGRTRHWPVCCVRPRSISHLRWKRM